MGKGLVSGKDRSGESMGSGEGYWGRLVWGEDRGW